MVTPEHVEQLYATTLAPRLQALETLRRSLKGYIVKSLAAVGVPFVLFQLGDLFTTSLTDTAAFVVSVGLFALIFAGAVVAAIKYAIPGFTAYANYRARFKREVAGEVFKLVNPGASYHPLHGVAETDFDEPGLFNTRGNYRSDDRVHGRIGETPFEAAEVRRSYSTGGKNNTTVVVFHGLFFHLDFNKSLRGVTVVQPTDARASQLGSRDGLREVTLENPEFAQRFAVFTSDEVEARYVLTPAMMEQILALGQRAAKPLFLAFKGQRAYLGVHYGQSLFEPGIASTTSLAAVKEMAEHFHLAEVVVRELDLNTRIWTKRVDDTLLARTVDAEQDDKLSRLAASGEVTASELWEAAMEAAEGRQQASDNVPAPPETRIRVEEGSATTTIVYGLPVSWYITVLVWAVATAVMIAAAPQASAFAGIPALGPLVAALPAVPYASSLVGGQPLIWFAISTIVTLLCLSMWALRVRKVEIAADAIRVWRGVRPFPRTYPRPDFGKVVSAGRAVYVGKTTGFHLVNPTASPMLSSSEVPWIAAVMRRALASDR